MSSSQIMDLQTVCSLSCSMLRDFGRICSVDVMRDIEEFTNRISNEGSYFVTRALLGFGRDLLRAVDQGRCSSDMFRGFRRKRNGGYPLFLQGFLERIFDHAGVVLPAKIVDRNCFKAVYQICLSWYKYEVDCPEAIVREQYRKFVSLDSYIGGPSSPLLDDAAWMRKSVLYGMWKVLDVVLSELDVNEDNLFPRHGSGSTSEGLTKAFQKWEFVYDHLVEDEDLFPTLPIVGRRLWEKRDRCLFAGDPGLTPVATLTDVHKDSRGRRLISKESTKQMMIQQAMFRVFVDYLENNEYTGGHVNFTDQSINQHLSLASTRMGGYWATIDWKDASDRISWEIVQTVFPPRIVNALGKARTEFYTIPEGKFELIGALDESVSVLLDVPDAYTGYRGVKYIHRDFDIQECAAFQRFARRYYKHAPMGSAMCFPVMAMFIWACAVARVSRELTNVCDKKHLLHYASQFVYVYGDDLIVPAELAQPVISDLESLGMLCNRDKSFVGAAGGNIFRESCGVDAFNGADITPIKFTKVFPQAVTDIGPIESWVEYTNRLAERGLLQAASDAYSIVRTAVGERLIGLLHDSINPDAICFSPLVSALVHWSFAGSPVPTWNEALHLYERQHVTSQASQYFISLTPKSESVSLFRWLAEHDSAEQNERHNQIPPVNDSSVFGPTERSQTEACVTLKREINLAYSLPERTVKGRVIIKKDDRLGWMETDPRSNVMKIQKTWWIGRAKP